MRVGNLGWLAAWKRRIVKGAGRKTSSLRER